MKKFYIISLVLLSLFSCDKKDDVSYPYTEHEIIYMGAKAGLTSFSSEQAFENALNEIMQQFSASQPNSSTEFTFDGITYDITNLREVTGGIPNSIWDIFWEDISEYGYSIGSCWGFVHATITSKGGTGTAYFIYAIATSDNYGDGEVLYVAVQGNVTPIGRTRYFVNRQDPVRFIIDGDYITRQQNEGE
jgi:hypothetical protein